MRLLDCGDGKIQLAKAPLPDNTGYAILSHTWGPDTEEVTFKDLIDGTEVDKTGYKKIRFCAAQARRDGLRYFWVDTCCIDKANNTELSEAINSMFRWYRNAARCYVYLSDMSIPSHENNQQSGLEWESAFRAHRWFTRGWTLQELLAPASVEFFTQDGRRLGDKRSLEQQIHEITGIAVLALQGTDLSQFNIEERFKWAETRQTTREEDWAYCLLGIFGIFMPLIHGEGKVHAVRRLKKEIAEAMNRNDTPSYQGGYSEGNDNAPRRLEEEIEKIADATEPGAPETSWEHAVTVCLSRLSAEQASQFRECTNVKEFLDAVTRRIGQPKDATERFWWPNLLSNKRYRIWKIINKSLRPLNRFGQVADVHVQINSTICSTIWGPLKLVVQICCDHVDLLDYLDRTLSAIDESIDRIICYENIFGKNQMVQQALGCLYADYLDFCTRLIKYNKRNTAIKLFMTFEQDFQAVCTSMKEHEQRFNFTAIAAYIAEDTTARRREIEQRKRTLFRDILQWIGGPPEFDEDIRKLRGQRREGSCSWFRGLKHYNRWKNSRYHVHGLLWVYGPPGCGKSVLASSIIDDLLQSKETTRKPVFYFFCKNDNSNKNNSLAILRSLTAQLLLWSPTLFTLIEDSYLKSGKRQIDSFYSLLPIFLSCLAHLRSEFLTMGGNDENDDCNGYIVIDGIDECDEAIVSDFCSAVKLWFEARPETMISLLFTSRYSQHINNGLSEAMPQAWKGLNCPPEKMAYQITTRDTEQYVPEFIKAGVARSTSLRAAEAAGLDVSGLIVKAAAGHWLYARLALEDAKAQLNLRSLRESLANLPNGLPKLYSQILIAHQERLDEDHLRVAKTIFEWVCLARIPKPLRVEEMSAILSIKIDQHRLNPEDKPLDCNDLIQRLCAPLLEIDDSQRIHVTHHSVKEYFLKSSLAKATCTSETPPIVVGNLYETAMSLACTASSFVLLEDVQRAFNDKLAKTTSYELIAEEVPLLQHMLLPLWDWYGNYAYQAGAGYTEGLLELEGLLGPINQLARFLTSQKNLPWIITTLHTYGQHDLSVLFTRIALCVALSKGAELPLDKTDVWRALFPDSFDEWLTEFYALARQLKWNFRFFEVIRNGALSSGGDTKIPEINAEASLGSYSQLTLPILENFSFPDYGYYDDNEIHFSRHEENNQIVSDTIMKSLKSYIGSANAMEDAMSGQDQAPGDSGYADADGFAHRLRPDIGDAEKSHTFTQARQMFRDGQWDLWWFSSKSGQIYQRLGRGRHYPY